MVTLADNHGIIRCSELSVGAWSRDMNTACRAGRGIEAGRVWTNGYDQHPKNLLVSYRPDKLGFF